MTTRISDKMYDEEDNFLSNKKFVWLNPAKLSEFDANNKSVILCHQSDLLYGPNFTFFERHFKSNPRTMLIFIERPPTEFSFNKSIKKVVRPLCQPGFIPADFIEMVLKDGSQTDMAAELKSTADDDIMTQPGTLQDSKMGEPDNLNDHFYEKEILFRTGVDFLQFSLTDHQLPRTEFGIVLTWLIRDLTTRW